MSTVAEIKEAISHLPEDARQEIATWVQSICQGERKFTADGLDGRHSIVRTGIYLIGVTSFTNLTLFHLDFRYGEKLIFVLFISA